MNTQIINYPSPAGDVGIYALLSDLADGKVYDGTTTLAVWVDGNLGNYDVPLTYLGGNRYLFTIPANLPTGNFQAVFKKKSTAVAAPALTDIKLPDEWNFRWNGSSATPAPAPGDPVSDYHTYAEFLTRWGTENVRVSANKDNTDMEDIDTVAVQQSFDFAASEITSYFSGGPYALPFVFDGDVPATVKDWAMTLAYDHLYTSRGLEDKSANKEMNRIAKMRAAVYVDMGFHKSGIKSLSATRATDGSANTAHAEPTPLYGTPGNRPADASPIVILE